MLSFQNEHISDASASVPQTPPLHSLIFPSRVNVSKISASVSRAVLSIRNRLRSIEEDSEFVWQVARGEVAGFEACEGMPVLANERCGGWYVDPALKVDAERGSCYFKSTDGHFVSDAVIFHSLWKSEKSQETCEMCVGWKIYWTTSA